MTRREATAGSATPSGNTRGKRARRVLRGGWLVAFITAVGTAAVLTHLPLEPETESAWEFLPHQDKAIHVGIYAMMSAIGFGLLKSRGTSSRNAALVTIAFFLIWAGLDEVTQIPVGRHADGFDWLADCLGATLGIGLGWLAWRRGRESKTFSFAFAAED
jgi:VanZ family protein